MIDLFAEFIHNSPNRLHRRQRAVIGDVQVGEQASIWFGTVRAVTCSTFASRSYQTCRQLRFAHAHRELPTILEDQVTVGTSVTLHGCYVEHGSLIGIGSIVLMMCGSGHSPGGGRFPGLSGYDNPPRSLVMECRLELTAVDR